MIKLGPELIHFFQDQGFVIVSTIDSKGFAHNSCKGIVEIRQNGLVYLLDLYHGQTYQNLKNNRAISISAVDEHRFKGFCLKGMANLGIDENVAQELFKAWEDRITSRLTQRVLKNISGDRGHPRHPEVMLPKPKYLIAMEVEEVVDLTPHHLKQKV